MIHLGVKVRLLDQTILQAIGFFESYVALNKQVHTNFLQCISIIAIEIAIKNNEFFHLSL